jgi:hypothetical protein
VFDDTRRLRQNVATDRICGLLAAAASQRGLATPPHSQPARLKRRYSTTQNSTVRLITTG